MIFRILLIVLGIWILWQLLSIFGGKNKKGSTRKSSITGKNMVKDPVCGMYMDPRLALKHETNTGVFYFCSEACKNNFLQETSGEKPGTSSRGE